MRRRWRLLMMEFAHHLPYTFASTLIAMGAVWWFGVSQAPRVGSAWSTQLQWSFHILHPLHVCLSAIATTSVFWRHERRLMKAVLVGFFGTIIPCGLSDYVFPFVGGRLLGQAMELHICLIDDPMVVLPFVTLGILGGLLFEERLGGSSVFSHGVHVFVSSLASLLYLAAFGWTGWLSDARLVFPVFLVVVVAVWLPCCISDIAIPVSAVNGHGHAHPHPHPRPYGRDRAVSRTAL